MLSIQHEAEKFFAKIGIPNGVKENGTILIAETRDDSVRRGLSYCARVVAGSDLYWQRVILGRAV